jgi:hypothetical protein
MTLLDRFRTTAPRHKHPDPEVRLAFVAEVPLDDRNTLASVAREDEDPRVRRAAIAKLMDPAILGRIAREDADEGVRAEASGMLRDIALEAFEGLGEAEGLDAVDGLVDARTLTQIAREAPREIVALRALSRITDQHAWGSIARHSATEATRRGALELLRERGDRAELLAVAMNGEFKDTAVACVDLVSDRDQLEQIAMRGKNKAAAKRARTIIREADARDAERAAQASSVQRPPLPVDLLVQQTMSAAPAVANSDRDSGEAERLRDEAEAAAKAAEEAARAAEARAARDAEEMQARDVERRHARLSELAGEADKAADDVDVASARKGFGVVRREWNEVSTGLTVDEAVAARFAEAERKLVARETQWREADARARREAHSRLLHLVGRVEPLVTRTDLTLALVERALRDVRTALATVPPLPTKQDADEVSRRLKAAQAALTPKLQELRDADDWQRWANAGIQEQLCVQMEALLKLDDPEAIARDVRALQEQWRRAADVPRAQADALWRRFKTAHDAVWPRCEAHFAAEAQVRNDNLAKRTALCEKAESLAESTSWIQTAEEIKRLQAEWKTIGPVPRGREKAIWERFRSACDRFFTRRHEDLAKRKTIWAENLARKAALCEKAEALAQSTEWDQTAAELKRLQAEWKTIGPVKKTRSEAIWQRFRSACDAFFLRYAHRHDIAREERVAAREAICAELEALAPAAPTTGTNANVAEEAGAAAATEAPADLLARVRSLRGRWQNEIAARGVDLDRARALDQRFATAYAGVLSRWPAVFAGTDLDPDANRKRMESIVQRMEDLARSIAGPLAENLDASLSPSVRLAAMLKEALAANTMGGKVEDDSRLRAAAEDVRQAQASWSRIGPVPEEVRRPLVDRFQRACQSILGRAGQAGGSGKPGTSGELSRAGR